MSLKTRYIKWLRAGLLIGPTTRTSSLPQAIATPDALKVAYTYHFLELVQWEQEGTELKFCVFGQSDVGNEMLKTLDKRRVSGLVIKARQIAQDRVAASESCQALYISDKYSEQVPALLMRLENTPTLTISDELLAKLQNEQQRFTDCRVGACPPPS